MRVLLKMSTEGESLRSPGRLFQRRGSQWLKAEPLVCFRCNLRDDEKVGGARSEGPAKYAPDTHA